MINLGISGFGLHDHLSVKQDRRDFYQDFFLADAVLPLSPLGKIRTGQEAEDERIHTGLNWPPEARLDPDKFIRRAPIPLVWRALVEAGDSPAYWKTAKQSFPLVKILTAHLNNLAEEGEVKNPDVCPVVAIPNHLDEYGQEALLRELGGQRNPILVWRPVAAALAWLEEVQDQIDWKAVDPGYLLVIYLGPDALEMTAFSLKQKVHDHRPFLLPVRKRPGPLFPFTGFHWAGQVIEELCGQNDPAAWWQVFTNFPEVWQVLAGFDWNREELPRIMTQGQTWVPWQPGGDLPQQVQQLAIRPSLILGQIIATSCKLNELSGKDSGQTWAGLLEIELRRVISQHPDDRLRGVILCGSLAPRELPQWLINGLTGGARQMISLDGDLIKPQPGRLWNPVIDPIAPGAAIYKDRLDQGLPTYLDTLPQLAILAQRQGRRTWIHLTDDTTTPGGEEYNRKISGQFQLKGNNRYLPVYLIKDDEGAIDTAGAEDPTEPIDLPASGVAPCKARVIRALVRHLQSPKAVKSKKYSLIKYSEIFGYEYALRVAGLMFEPVRELPQETEPEKNGGRYRKAEFDFPAAPDQDTLLDLDIRMKPASGLARIEMRPHQDKFLMGRRVRMNYDSMRRTSHLPPQGRGWPGIRELPVCPEDGLLKEAMEEFSVKAFFQQGPDENGFINTADYVRDYLLKRTENRRSVAGIEIEKLYSIDQNGRACTDLGNKLIKDIAAKFNVHFIWAVEKGRTKIADKLMTRAAWLWLRTPAAVVDYTRDILATHKYGTRWNYAVEAASRCFGGQENIRFLLDKIARRAENHEVMEPFPINAARAIYRVLAFRPNGESSMSVGQARFFAGKALERLMKDQDENHFKGRYFENIRLMFFLLRCRRTNPDCFDPNDEFSIKPFIAAKESLKVARKSRFILNAHRRAVDNIIEGIDQFLHYQGSETIIEVIGKLAEDNI